MAKLTREQYNKWNAALADGWKFEAQHYIMWGDKEAYTDSAEDERGNFYRAKLTYYEERTGEGWTAKSTGRQLPALVIDRWNKTSTDGVYSSVQVLKETVGEPQNKKNYSVLAKLSASLDMATYFTKAAEADTGKAYNTIFDFMDDGAEAEPAQEAEESPETAEAVTDTTEETSGAEAQEIATEDAPEIETIAEQAAPDMFATFAAAYLSGKTVKSAPKEEPKPAEPEEPKAEEPEEPPRDGYEKTSDFFTEEEVKTLSSGVPVMRKEKYNNAAYITAPYSDGAKLIYYVSSHEERDTVNPGKDAKFWGVLIGGTVYNANDKAISAKFTDDINRFLLGHVKSETDAARAAANVGEYERGRINAAKERDYTEEARRAFFDKKPPVLVLCEDSGYPYGWDELIKYLQEPEKAIEAAALRYLCDNPEKVYIAYIIYNRVSASYEAIKSDENNEEHKLARISDCITSQKSVRVELSNGHEVKVEADAVKRLKYSNYISAFRVSAYDRKYLRKNEYGHDEDIKADDIVSITHGGRVLYKSA